MPDNRGERGKKNYWLYNKLREAGRKIEAGPEPLVVVSYRNKVYRVYVPGPGEYAVTIDVVKKAIGLGADTVSYAISWCTASEEAKLYGKNNGVRVIPHGALFGILLSPIASSA